MNTPRTTAEIAEEISRWCSGGVIQFQGSASDVMDCWKARIFLALDTERTARMEAERLAESLRKENEFMHEAIYKEAVAEGIHDRLNDAQKERDEAMAELRKSGEALKPYAESWLIDATPSEKEKFRFDYNACRKAKEVYDSPLMKKVLESGG